MLRQTLSLTLASSVLIAGSACVSVETDPSVALESLTANSAGANGHDAVSRNTTAALRFATISAGFEHTCAVMTDSTVRCWGDNSYGQLGLPGTT